MTASSCACCSSRSARRSNVALRCAGERRCQRPSSNAALALATAMSTSRASQAAISARTFPVAGFVVWNVLPDTAGTKAPSMNACVGSASFPAIAAYSDTVRS